MVNLSYTSSFNAYLAHFINTPFIVIKKLPDPSPRELTPAGSNLYPQQLLNQHGMAEHHSL